MLQRKNNSQPRSNKLDEHNKDWGTQKQFNLLYRQNPEIKRRNEIHHKPVLQMSGTICCLLWCSRWQLYIGGSSGTQKNLTFLSCEKSSYDKTKEEDAKKIKAFVLQRKNNSQPRSDKPEEHKKDWGTQKDSIFCTNRTQKSKGEMKYITNLSSKCRTLFVVFFVALGDNFTSGKAQEHKKM